MWVLTTAISHVIVAFVVDCDVSTRYVGEGLDDVTEVRAALKSLDMMFKRPKLELEPVDEDEVFVMSSELDVRFYFWKQFVKSGLLEPLPVVLVGDSLRVPTCVFELSVPDSPTESETDSADVGVDLALPSRLDKDEESGAYDSQILSSGSRLRPNKPTVCQLAVTFRLMDHLGQNYSEDDCNYRQQSQCGTDCQFFQSVSKSLSETKLKGATHLSKEQTALTSFWAREGFFLPQSRPLRHPLCLCHGRMLW